MQAMKLEKDNAMDRADACEQQAKDANLRAERVIFGRMFHPYLHTGMNIRITICGDFPPVFWLKVGVLLENQSYDEFLS
jgi:hypothetical protein